MTQDFIGPVQPSPHLEAPGINLKVTIVDDEVRKLFARAPRATFAAIRNYAGRIFGHHRKTWIAETAVRLKIEGGENFDRAHFYGGIFGKARSFRFEVKPSTRAVPDNPELSQISGRVYTDSTAALGLETGGTWRPKHGQRFLAIPLKRGRDKLGRKKRPYTSPRRARQAGKTFFTFRAKRSHRLYLAELIAKGRGANKRYAFKPTFLLVTQVTQKPILRFIDAWHRDEGYRTKAMGEAMDEIHAGLRRG